MEEKGREAKTLHAECQGEILLENQARKSRAT